MKDLQMYFEQCKKELDSIGVKYGEVDYCEVNTRAKKRWGQCRRWGNSFIISISSRLLADDVTDEALKTTILHELLHTCYKCQNHGLEWKAKAEFVNRKLGYNIKRTSSSKEKGVKPVESTNTYPYVFKCETCGQIVRRQRASKFTKYYSDYRCGKCCGKFKKVS